MRRTTLLMLQHDQNYAAGMHTKLHSLYAYHLGLHSTNNEHWEQGSQEFPLLTGRALRYLQLCIKVSTPGRQETRCRSMQSRIARQLPVLSKLPT